MIIITINFNYDQMFNDQLYTINCRDPVQYSRVHVRILPARAGLYAWCFLSPCMELEIERSLGETTFFTCCWIPFTLRTTLRHARGVEVRPRAWPGRGARVLALTICTCLYKRMLYCVVSMCFAGHGVRRLPLRDILRAVHPGADVPRAQDLRPPRRLLLRPLLNASLLRPPPRFHEPSSVLSNFHKNELSACRTLMHTPTDSQAFARAHRIALLSTRSIHLPSLRLIHSHSFSY